LHDLLVHDPRPGIRRRPPGTNTRPRGAVWSARHPVTVEIVGSSPIGGA